MVCVVTPMPVHFLSISLPCHWTELHDPDGSVCDPDCDDYNDAGCFQELCNDADACNYNWAGDYPDGYPSAIDFCQYPDVCGVCGGDGIPEGACDCQGNVPRRLWRVRWEFHLCIVELTYSLEIESSPAVGDGGTVYRFFVNALDDADTFSAVYGTDEEPMHILAEHGVWNSIVNVSWNASGLNPAFVSFFLDMVDDSYATINLDVNASSSSIPNAQDPSLVEDTSLSPTLSGFFTEGSETEVAINTITGASWYVLNTAKRPSH